METKRDKMIGFMVTKELEKKLRDEAARQRTTMSSLVYAIVQNSLQVRNDHPTGRES